MQVLWGAQTPQNLQKCVELFEMDLEASRNGTLEMSGITKLAGLGARGARSQHCWSGLLAWLPKPNLPPLHWVFLPLHHNILGKFSKNMPMILPHKLFPAIWRHYPLMFDKLVYGSADHCRKFWRAVKGSEQFRSYTFVYICGFFILQNQNKVVALVSSLKFF